MKWEIFNIKLILILFKFVDLINIGMPLRVKFIYMRLNLLINMISSFMTLENILA